MTTLRRHQRLALAALASAWGAGARRAWVVLPPGAGKTLVGIETARAMLGEEEVAKVVVLTPNTAIQGQWARAARTGGLLAGDQRDLRGDLTALTYQSLATFDPERGGPEDDDTLLERLHPNGRALVDELRAAGPLLLVLDECHHLLEVWGRLLAEVLEQLPEARVLGLTATPPAAMTVDEASLVGELFGATVFEASIPAVVKEGDLAPFAEMVWPVEPSPTEREWLAQSALRFQELTSALIGPGFGSIGLLTWLGLRCAPAPKRPGVTWGELSRTRPELCRAVLRLHHAGLIALPGGATMHEEHRVEPTADDWVELIDDWVRGHLRTSDDPADADVLARVRAALPAVGYVLTRQGVRAGRSPVDRVLARSEAKTYTAASIARAERLALGSDLRLLVLCDHEFAAATVPSDLDGVLDAQAGSARAALATLQADPETSDVLLVTGASVAAAPAMLTRLVEHVAAVDPELARELRITDDRGVSVLAGPARWSSRTWTPLVTRFFEEGGATILIGTRGLLGEGWDARRVTGVVDLTAVTTTTAVVQTRGRALRTDPDRPEKVALNWTVVCVAAGHPRGDNDWQRLVRKHTGFFGVDADGAVVDGVAHLDPAFSPYAPPATADFAAICGRMLTRAERRDQIRERWRVGAPYADQVARTVRIRPGARSRLGPSAVPVTLAVRADAVELRSAPARRGRIAPAVLGVAGVAAAVEAWALAGPLGGAAAAVLTAVAAGTLSRRSAIEHGRELVRIAAEPPSLVQIASALADALHGTGRTTLGAAAVEVTMDSSGEYRASLRGASEAESTVFATGLEELLSPVFSPRYVVPRYVVVTRERSGRELARLARRHRLVADGVVWHAVPTALSRRKQADAFAAAWDHWVGGGPALYTGSPEGAGVLAAQRGSDPFDVTTVTRREWS